MSPELIRFKENLREHAINGRLGKFVYELNASKPEPNNTNLQTEYATVVQATLKFILEEMGENNSNSTLFIHACLAHGASCNVVMDQENYPLDVAAQNCAYEILEKLLSCQHTRVDRNQMTRALELLGCIINRDNYKQAMKCIALLLHYNAEIPASWFNDAIPPSTDEKRTTVRNKLLEQCRLNETDNEEVGKCFDQHIPNDRWKTYCFLRNHTGSEGADTLNDHDLISGTLTACCKSGNYSVLYDVFRLLPEDRLKELLAAKRSNGTYVENNLLILLIHRVNGNDKHCPFFKCLRLCVSNRLIDLDETDGRACCALDYAAKYKLKHVQKLLLQNGAYLGGKDVFGNYTICKIDPTVLKQHFDSCIYTIGEGYEGRETDQSRIFVMLENFIPPAYKTNRWRRNKSKESSESSRTETNESILQALLEFTNESEICASRDVNKDIRLELIEHPVISTLLCIRDQPQTWTIHALKLVRAVPLLMLLLGCIFSWTDTWHICATLFVQIALFCFELSKNFKNYLKCLPRLQQMYHSEEFRFQLADIPIIWLIELGLISTIIYTWLACPTGVQEVSVLHCMTMLAGIAMGRCIASYSLFDENIHTLQIVYSNVCKHLLIVSFAFVTFAIFLFVSEPHEATPPQSSSTNSTCVTCKTDCSSITWRSKTMFGKLLQTIAMFSGDLHTDEMQLQVLSYILFILGLVFMTVVLPCKLIAFAIDDVSAIKKESKRLKIALTANRLFLRESTTLSKCIRHWFYPPHDCHDVQYIAMVPEKRNEIELFKLSDSAPKRLIAGFEFEKMLENHIRTH